VRVEQADITLDDNFDAALNAVATGIIESTTTPSTDMETLGAAETTPMETTETAEARPTASVKLTYDEYKRISNMLVYYIRKKEEEFEATLDEPETSEQVGGVHRSELIAWYLEEIESQIESEQQLKEQTALIEKIIHRLITYVSSI
jgi:DNA replication licensing factor MCM6